MYIGGGPFTNNQDSLSYQTRGESVVSLFAGTKPHVPARFCAARVEPRAADQVKITQVDFLPTAANCTYSPCETFAASGTSLAGRTALLRSQGNRKTAV